MAQTQTIPRDKFLHMSVNLLYKSLLESSRTHAKGMYRELAEGKTLPLTRVRMEDGSLVQFDLCLDHSEYRGKLGFGGFRTSLTELIALLSDALREERQVLVFSSQDDPDIVIFGVAATTWENGEPSVMVLGADAGPDQPAVLLKLMYLDYGQFARNTAGEVEGDVEQGGVESNVELQAADDSAESTA